MTNGSKGHGHYRKQNKTASSILLSQINAETFILTKSTLKDSSSKTYNDETWISSIEYLNLIYQLWNCNIFNLENKQIYRVSTVSNSLFQLALSKYK